MEMCSTILRISFNLFGYVTEHRDQINSLLKMMIPLI